MNSSTKGRYPDDVRSIYGKHGGRIARIVAGILLIVLGLLVMQNTTGIILAVVGLVPLLAGLLDLCVFAPLFGAPLSGKAIRTTK